MAKNPLPAVALESLEADQRLRPAVREAAIAMLKRLRIDPSTLVAFCQDLIANPDAGDDQYHAALRCAQALAEIEPGTLRARVLLGGAQFRAGLVQEAAATLTAPADPAANGAATEAEYAYGRGVFLLLAEHRLGKTSDARELDRFLTSPPRLTTIETSSANYWTFRLFTEARQALGWRFPMTRSPGTTFVPDDDYLRRMFVRSDTSGDQRLDVTEAAKTPVGREFGVADANSDGHVSQEEFLANVRARIESGRLRFGSPTRPRQDYDQQLSDVIAGLEQTPEDPQLLNNRAWLLATMPDEALRDGKEAIKYATKVCELSQWRDPQHLDTLAAAYAEVGDFAAAIKYQQKALELLTDGSGLSRTDFESRLALYRENKPYRLPGRYQTIANWGRSVDPLGDCEVTADGESLRIKIPGSLHNLSPRSYGTDAPRVLAPVEGDFTAEVKVSCSIQPQTSLPGASTAYHGAGLLVFADAVNFLRVERNGYFRDWDREPSFGRTGRTPLSSNAPTVEYWSGGRIAAQHANWSGSEPQLPGESTWLRIERRGASLKVGISHDGTMWQDVKTFETTLPTSVKVGVHAINATADALEASFSELKITRP